ncbi:hypothetical protein M0813_03144 [Anaeramoeba flamelloides]|uniref:DUF659 domain-containing protein n=1 Tax=Anaeramoeba flamelloides TaxID=1746091 RepID=A0ABQ8Y3N7_9EUKA|nr:hypothetical protein M0813_03144 [Anaeramoeba flamelloides]
MKRHLTTTKHRRCSILFSEDVELRQTLPQELVKIFFQCGINIHAGSKLLQQSGFLRLIRTHQNFPSENTLRKHVEVLVQNEKRMLKTQLANIKFSLIFDETTISNSRPVIGIIASNYQNSFCLRVGNLINGEAKTIYNIINETLEFYSINYNQILALISDGARACISVGQMFQNKKIQHVVCGAHTLALITSLLIKIFEKVNLLITNVNTFFSTGKQSSRKRRWIEKYQKLIPKPSLIRWGTWFKTCISVEKNRLNLIAFVQKELASDNRNNLLLLLKDPECIEQLRLINYFGLIMNNLIINIQKKIISNDTISDWMNLKSRLFEMYSTMGSVYLLRIKREVNLISENSLFLLKSFFNQVYQRYYPRWLLTERIIRKQMFFTLFLLNKNLIITMILFQKL